MGTLSGSDRHQMGQSQDLLRSDFNVLKSDLNKSLILPFGANLTHFRSNLTSQVGALILIDNDKGH